MAISMLKIRRPLGRLIFNMGIAIPVKTVFLIETAPWQCIYVIEMGLGNILLPVQHQIITWTNTDILSIGPSEANFGQIRIKIQISLVKKTHLKMLSDLNVLAGPCVNVPILIGRVLGECS